MMMDEIIVNAEDQMPSSDTFLLVIASMEGDTSLPVPSVGIPEKEPQTRPQSLIPGLSSPISSRQKYFLTPAKRKDAALLWRLLFFCAFLIFSFYLCLRIWTPHDQLVNLDWLEVGTVIESGSYLMEERSSLQLQQQIPRRTRPLRQQVTASNGSPTPTRQLPQAIIIGVKKGGTRALLEYIRMHPQVRAPGSEMHFFDRHYERGIDWYRNQMPLTSGSQITIEKTPSYFVTRDVPKRVYQMDKKMKLIIVVRDPITRAISDYTQARSKGRSNRDFHEMAFYSNGTHRLLDTSWGALRIGLYSQHLDKWLKYFPLEQMLFVSGEELIHNPVGQMDKVQEFLGLTKLVGPQHFFFDSKKGFPCLKRPDAQMRPRCLGKSKGRQHPHIAPDVIAQLRDFYKKFNQRLYSIVGKDFHWM
ncbi:hypothetical protein RvY_09849 [Ramazzottius varieornatus]|uniref:Sulfotransferase domain-containing protein n=1 Tax=Ramazzottius varieornatus TaxID=947166 RepID=A0A1D1VAS0_RAMVA|nr:hypothetical protein RvY_09849 [Ramazzottius varieornatus]